MSREQLKQLRQYCHDSAWASSKPTRRLLRDLIDVLLADGGASLARTGAAERPEMDAAVPPSKPPVSAVTLRCLADDIAEERPTNASMMYRLADWMDQLPSSL
jgi:hypothetical protein